jgi:hypothetical protein
MDLIMIKKTLINAINTQQLSHALADAIAAAAGIDLTEAVDPVKTADDLLFIGQQLQQSGVIDECTANSYRLIADSIIGNLDKFEVA